MPPLYITQQGAKIRIHQSRLLVELEGEKLLHVPLGHVSEVVVFGNVGLTTPAVGQLLDCGLDVVFLREDGAYRGRLTAGLTPHVPVRRAQYRTLEKPDFVLEISKGLVRAKLSHQRTLLQRHNRERGDPEIGAVVEQIGAALENTAHKTTRASLLGLEGSGTASYFRGFRRLFDPSWRFEARNRRPPTDPINVLLSLGYTLLGQLAYAAVQAAGLDPYAGFYHEVVYNRPALALDLLEEFRPVVDGVVLWACNSGQITSADFSAGPPERPVVLSDEGRKRFLQAYETRLDGRFTHPLAGKQLTLRQCVFEQARQVANRVLQNQPGYTGMGFR